MPTEFTSLLPPNADDAERALERCATEAMKGIPHLIRAAKDPATCPEVLLPWLAWEYAVDTWNPAWTVEEKRRVIARAAYIHRHRGTPSAVEMALTDSPFDSRIVEWFEQQSDIAPYTFQVQLTQGDRPLRPGDIQDVYEAVLRSKNLRSWFDVTIEGQLDGELVLAGYLLAAETVSLVPDFVLEGIEVNGWRPATFAPVTSFRGAAYQLATRGAFGEIAWRADGPAAVDGEGRVTITGPGAITVTGVDGLGREIRHRITPSLFFIPSETQMPLKDMPDYVAGQGGRMGILDEFALEAGKGPMNAPAPRRLGGLFNEWGRLDSYGWRAWRNNDESSGEELWGTGSFFYSAVNQRAIVGLATGYYSGTTDLNPAGYSTATVIETGVQT